MSSVFSIICTVRNRASHIRRSVELAPGWAAPKANLALVLGRMGRPAEAMELLDDVFAAEPEELGHWNLKAATLGRLGDFDEAIAMYEAVLEQVYLSAGWKDYSARNLFEDVYMNGAEFSRYLAGRQPELTRYFTEIGLVEKKP